MSSLKHIVSHLQITWYGLLALLVLLFIILSTCNSSSLASVSIRLKEGQTEHRDKTIPFVSKKGDELPDYRITYLSEDQWRVVGTAFNTSASDWLEFKISDPPSMTLVQAIRISDDDPAKDDHLEEIQLVNDTPKGKVFDYKVKSTMSFKAGMAWFASTALGKAIFGGIALAVFLVALSYLGG